MSFSRIDVQYKPFRFIFYIITTSSKFVGMLSPDKLGKENLIISILIFKEIKNKNKDYYGKIL